MVLPASSVHSLLACKDYRSFISTLKDERSKLGRFSYGMIAMRAGFASRSFPRDVAVGAKRISLASLQPFTKGLGIRGDLAEYFKTLVYVEHPEICYPAKSSLALNRQLKNLRGRLQTKRAFTESDPFQSEFFPLVYAACGDQTTGASASEIAKRTRLKRAQVDKTLREMHAMKVIRREGSNFYPMDSHYFFEGMKQSDAFKHFFQYLLTRASDEARRDFSSSTKLFFTSSFSVREGSLEHLRADLKSVLLNYVDAAESPEGERVASLVCSLI